MVPGRSSRRPGRCRSRYLILRTDARILRPKVLIGERDLTASPPGVRAQNGPVSTPRTPPSTMAQWTRKGLRKVPSAHHTGGRSIEEIATTDSEDVSEDPTPESALVAFRPPLSLWPRAISRPGTPNRPRRRAKEEAVIRGSWGKARASSRSPGSRGGAAHRHHSPGPSGRRRSGRSGVWIRNWSFRSPTCRISPLLMSTVTSVTRRSSNRTFTRPSEGRTSILSMPERTISGSRTEQPSKPGGRGGGRRRRGLTAGSAHPASTPAPACGSAECL